MGSTRGRSSSARGQSTISFAHRVTKNVHQDKDLKKDGLAPALKNLDAEELSQPPVKVDDVVVDEPQIAEPEPEAEPEVVKTDEELRAEKVSEAGIKTYWKGIEAERKHPRLHQQDLSVHEKVLRYFDVSSQYGVSQAHCHSLIPLDEY
jgi:DNA polymerase delta subunit 4